MVPLMEKNGAIEEQIEKVVDTLFKLENISSSLKTLTYGIEWLIVDKFIENKRKRNILRDLLGEKMSLIYEYGKDKEQKGIDKGRSREQDRIITNLLKSGLKPEQIAQATKTPLNKINAIKKKHKITT